MSRIPGFLKLEHGVEAGAVPEGKPLELCAPIVWPIGDNVGSDFVSTLLARFFIASFRPPDLLSIFAFRKDALLKLLGNVRQVFSREGNVLDVVIPPRGRIHVFGDTHGDLHSFLEGLAIAGWPSSDNYLCFAGDCVDRGSWGVEVLVSIFAMKLWQPAHVFVLRGNHETTGCAARYGFQKEVLRKYDEKVFAAFVKTFRELPCGAVIRTLPREKQRPEINPNCRSVASKNKAASARQGTRKKRRTRDQEKDSNQLGWSRVPIPGERRILVVHGGLFRSWRAQGKVSMELADLTDLDNINRRVEDPFQSILEDVLWSDPQTSAAGVAANVLRGAGILFGNGAVTSFFTRNHLDGLLRAHEGPDMREKRPEMGDMLQGFSVDMELRSGFVATVFSAAGYRKCDDT